MQSEPSRCPQPLPDGILGGLGFSTFFASILSSLANEPIIRRSPRGQAVKALLETLQDQQFDGIAVLLLSELGSCLLDGRKHKLPSLGEAAVWTAFQRVRNGEEVLGAWKDFIEASSPQAEEVNFTLQLILDRALKKMLRNEAEYAHHHKYCSNSGTYTSGIKCYPIYGGVCRCEATEEIQTYIQK